MMVDGWIIKNGILFSVKPSYPKDTYELLVAIGVST